MIRAAALFVLCAGMQTFGEWRKHRSGEMAAALSFFAAVALAAVALIGLYAAGKIVPAELLRATTSGLSHVAGPSNGAALKALLQAAKHGSWVPLTAGTGLLLVAVFATAMQLQAAVNFIWDVRDPKEDRAASSVGKQLPTFVLMFVLAFVLMIILLVGAGLHALAFVTHAAPLFSTLVFQAGNDAGSIVVLTLLFVTMFGRLPPSRVPRKALWAGGFATAIMYERAQFFLALYLGSIDLRSIFAEVGIGLAVLVWLYYSAQVVLVGANLTKVLASRKVFQ
ncbi:MAG: YihY/virulence factor BrkB family protein [Candidatus Eremiobacteraeota bacterium]|nr:YihY/virulence factor BrkB family protein [Candidatus Eremiobacteraeota bacterium]